MEPALREKAGGWQPEHVIRAAGCRWLGGVDEAGRGALAGPVVAAAVILPWPWPGPELDDSKRLSPERRVELFEALLAQGARVGVGVASHEEVDRWNVLAASLKAMLRAVERLQPPPDYLLVDGNRAIPQLSLPQTCVVGGDGCCPSIAGASIVAKVIRDRLMCQYHWKYPLYHFLRHKGYGTKEHLDALRHHGPCPIHRRTFSGVVTEQLPLASLAAER